jgi:hypothetical protein
MSGALCTRCLACVRIHHSPVCGLGRRCVCSTSLLGISHAALCLPVSCTQGMVLGLGTMQLLTERRMTGKGEFQNAAPNGPTWSHGVMGRMKIAGFRSTWISRSRWPMASAFLDCRLTIPLYPIHKPEIAMASELIAFYFCLQFTHATGGSLSAEGDCGRVWLCALEHYSLS